MKQRLSINAKFGLIKTLGMGYKSQPKRKASFLEENIQPIKESGQLDFVEDSG